MCSGGTTIQVDCPLGCLGAIGTSHCGVLVPSNGLDPAWLVGASADIVVNAGEILMFRTNDGLINRCGIGSLRSPGMGVSNGIYFHSDGQVGAFAIHSLTIRAGGVVRVEGTPAFALLASGDVDIKGTLTVSGGPAACNDTAACMPAGWFGWCAGPGAGAGGMANSPGTGSSGGSAGTSSPAGPESGGGGGGFGDVGGAGGMGGPAGGGMSGDSMLSPLSGGSGGGGGGQDGAGGAAGFGGGGGGAIQISSMARISIGPSPAAITAGGAGGGGASGTNGGGGGGSGGAIFLEAPLIVLDGGQLAANGGGGGGGTQPATDGVSGGLGMMPTPGGMGVFAGGEGGARSQPAGQDGSGISSFDDATGGGGGGVGRIFLRAPMMGITIMNGGLISPMESRGPVVVQ